MDNARMAAYTTLNRCFKDSSWSALTLDSIIKSEHLSERDASLATYITYGVIRNYRLLDYWIDSYCKKLDLEVRNILRMGMFQIKFSDKIPASAAVNESVELVKKSRFKSASGLVNAVLRKFSSSNVVYPKDLGIIYSHPDWLVNRLLSEHGYKFTEELLKANNSEAVLDYHEGFANGEKYVQDKAAYDAVHMLELKSGMSVLDSCAAPGGKSFTAAIMLGNTGSITACDIHPNKLHLIDDNAHRLGIDIIKTFNMDASEYHDEFDSKFDAVIADVPCSGFGVIRKKPEIRLKEESSIEQMSLIQKKIADNVSRYVKPGGLMLYSTCTIFPEENENISHSINNFELIKEKTYYPQIDNTDGFYASVLVRKI